MDGCKYKHTWDTQLFFKVLCFVMCMWITFENTRTFELVLHRECYQKSSFRAGKMPMKLKFQYVKLTLWKPISFEYHTTQNISRTVSKWNVEIKILSDIYIYKWSQIWRPWRPWVTSVSVPLRGFYVTRKHERPRRETETDVTHGLHGRHIWLHSVTWRFHSRYIERAHWAKPGWSIK